MASSAPSTPRRRFSSREYTTIDSNNDELTMGGVRTSSSSTSSPPRRSRLNSKEIPRTYSGLYGVGAHPPTPEIGDDDLNSNGGDNVNSPPRVKSSVHHTNHTHHHHTQNQSNLLPFELTRNRNTDWIAAGGPALLVTYISIILIFLLTFLAYISEPKLAWAMTDVAHALVSMVYLHWIKGNPADYMDGTQGEMNGMTTWEQIVSKPQTIPHPKQRKRSLQSRVTLAIKKLRSRDVLCVVPTLLAHASCHIAKYQFEYVVINVGVWFIVMIPKMPMMNGVRLLGINRTAGIDDGTDSSCQDDEKEEEDDDDTEEDLLLLETDDSKECCDDDEPKKNR